MSSDSSASLNFCMLASMFSNACTCCGAGSSSSLALALALEGCQVVNLMVGRDGGGALCTYGRG